MSKQITFLSQNESDVLGFKVARCNEDDFDEKKLLEEIVSGGYDFCRLKVAAEAELTPLKLHKIGCPFFFSGSIRRYKTPIKEKPKGDFIHPKMTYEMYDGTQDELLFKMLEGTWGEYPLGYYRTPYVKDLVNKEKEIAAVFKFYKKNNLNSLHPNNSIMFMNDEGKYVGFFALNKIEGRLESHIGGIIHPYRNGGYFLDMLRYIKNYCIDHHLSHFAFGARNENAEVQRIFQYVGFQPIGSENVFHILPMLSLCQVEEQEIELNDDNLCTIVGLVRNYLAFSQLSYKIIAHSSVSVDKIQNTKRLKALITIPVKTEEQAMLVFRVVEDGVLKRILYFELEDSD